MSKHIRIFSVGSFGRHSLLYRKSLCERLLTGRARWPTAPPSFQIVGQGASLAVTAICGSALPGATGPKIPSYQRTVAADRRCVSLSCRAGCLSPTKVSSRPAFAELPAPSVKRLEANRGDQNFSNAAIIHHRHLNVETERQEFRCYRKRVCTLAMISAIVVSGRRQANRAWRVVQSRLFT